MKEAQAPENTFAVVKEILAQDLGVDESLITEDAHLLETLELDSTDTVEIALQVKKRLGVDLELQIRDDPTVGAVVKMIDELQIGQIL